MRIILTVNAAWNVWNFRRPIVEDLLANGHDIIVLAPRDESVPKLEALGCRFVDLPIEAKSLNPLGMMSLYRSMRAAFRTHRPDVILSYTIKNNLMGSYAARHLKIPFIPNVTGLGTAFLSGGRLEMVATALYKSAFRMLPIIFFQNPNDQALFIDRGMVRPEQTRCLPGSGIDLAQFKPAVVSGELRDVPVFLMISRIIRDKGVLEFVEAAGRLKGQARFKLLGGYGTGNRTAISESDVQAWRDSGVIEPLGTTDDVRPFIADADCIVLPSSREGAPRTLIEAAAMGKPLIATDVPGCRQIVDDGINGFLCEVRNGQSLSEAMQRFLDLSAEESAQMGASSRAKMEREYDISHIISAYRNAIAHVTGQSV